MVSSGSGCPSTSSQSDECLVITGAELNTLIAQQQVCILDCRAHGSNVKTATRVRLPHVLFRRLQNGTLPLTNISSRLSDEDLCVVVIPEEEDAGPAAQSKVLIRALSASKTRSVRLLLAEDAEDILRRFPILCEESVCSKPAEDVTCLNLNSLRIEGSALASPSVQATTKTNDKRQVFPVQILPHLYLGNADTAKNKELLHMHGIHHIVNVTSNLPNFFEKDPDFHYLRVSVDDNASFNLQQFFPEAIAFIESSADRGDACLVHCLAGISRSVTICLAYLMATRKYSLEDAYDVVLGRNASIAPNFHFMGQLTDYEKHLGITSGRKSSAPRSPSCSAQAAALPSSCLTPPPTGFSSSNMRGFQD